jgi:hypothetical protein
MARASHIKTIQKCTQGNTCHVTCNGCIPINQITGSSLMIWQDASDREFKVYSQRRIGFVHGQSATASADWKSGNLGLLPFAMHSPYLKSPSIDLPCWVGSVVSQELKREVETSRNRMLHGEYPPLIIQYRLLIVNGTNDS